MCHPEEAQRPKDLLPFNGETMKKHIFLFFLILLITLTSCASPAQPVTADNVRTVSVPGFTDTVDADSIRIGSDGLEVCRIGTYTGTFVEQGTDEACKNVPALVVRNTSDRMIEKAVLVQGNRTFVATMLPPGGICLVQEQSGQAAQPTDNMFELVFREAVQFVQEDTADQDRVIVTTEKNRVSIQNTSDEDIPGSVNVWYKTKQNGYYFGGVSYKAAVDHGVLKADSTASVSTRHFDPEVSQILLITFTE